MKIRNGFVSNSSSSSFCIYGTCMESDDVIEKMKTLGKLTEEDLESLEDEGSWYIEELLYKKVKGLSVHQSEGTIWIGRDFTTIGDNETGKEFKDGVQTKLEEFIGEKVDCRIHEEEIYN